MCGANLEMMFSWVPPTKPRQAAESHRHLRGCTPSILVSGDLMKLQITNHNLAHSQQVWD